MAEEGIVEQSSVLSAQQDQQQQSATGEDQLVKMISCHGYSSSLVEDIQFRRFVETLSPGFMVPSKDEVEERCNAVFDQDMSNLKDAIMDGSSPCGLVSLSLGQAETSTGKVVYAMVHFIDGEWNLNRRVIQVFKAWSHQYGASHERIMGIKDYYTSWVTTYGENYVKLKETISTWGLLPKLCSVFEEETIFGDKLRAKLRDDSHLACLSPTQYKLLCATDICSELDMVAHGLMHHPKDEDFMYPYGDPWILAFQDLSLSPEKRREISSRLWLNHPWAFEDSWWYACYYALEMLHDCASPPAQIDGLVEEDTFQETVISELFRTTLGTIYGAIETISAFGSPTSNLCLIEILKVKKKLHSEHVSAFRRDENEYSDDEESSDSVEENRRSLPVQAILRRAKRSLHKLLIRSYLSLSIPLVLDPRFKLINVEIILKDASLSAGRISKVGDGIRQLFVEYSNQQDETEHSNLGNDMDSTNNHATGMNMDTSLQALDIPSSSLKDWCGSILKEIDTSYMEQDNTSRQTQARTELEDYLEDETVPMDQEDFIILKWWKDNNHRYPTVARMARDFLAIPTSIRPSHQQIVEITNHLRRYA